MKQIYIKDIHPGDTITDEYFQVDRYEVQVSPKNNSEYVKIVIRDKTGTLEGKIWNNNMQYCATCKKGDIVKLTGSTDVYNNNTQIKISKLRLVAEQEYDIHDFLSISEHSEDELMESIKSYINRIENEKLHIFFVKLFEDETFTKHFFHFPAGKRVHHAYIGGLAEHVLDMLQMSDPILKNHPLANKDVVYAGIILHDIGKLQELEELNYLFTYSLKGTMLGHIYIGAQWFNKSLPDDFSEELRERITHVILSHHGKLEYGSPVLPKTYEAIIVSKLDETSSSLNGILQAYSNANEGSDFSERLMSNNNESVYLRPFIE